MNTTIRSGAACLRSLAAATMLTALFALRPQPTRAATASVPAPPEISFQAQAMVTQIQNAITLEDWDAAARAVDRLQAAAAPGSYDAALAGLLRAQVLLSHGSISPDEQAAAISALLAAIDSGFWPRSTTLDWTYVVAQLQAQLGQPDAVVKSMLSWLAETTSPTAAGYVLLASAELELAQGAKPEASRVRYEQTLEYVAAGLRLGVRPDETLLYLKTACLQGLERWDEAAETFELCLKLHPPSPERWEQLLGLYLNAGRELPALVAIERGREHGALTAPSNDLVRGQLLHALGQDRMAIDALEAGLRRGVDDPAPHWIFAAFLAYAESEPERAELFLERARALPLNEQQQRDILNLQEALAARPASG